MVNERKTRFLAPTYFPKLSQHPNRLKKENELTTQKQTLAKRKKKLITDLAKKAIKGGANHRDRTWKNQCGWVFKGKNPCAQGAVVGVYEETLSSLTRSMIANLEIANPSTPNKFIDNKKKSQQKPQV